MDEDEVVHLAGQDRPVLLAGPTASGKSALAMRIAAESGGVIVNADAMQVFADWRVLTARPSAADEAALPHALYGHVPGTDAYSVGHWLRDIAPLLAGPRPIIVGGTGLYFTALTEGLAEIPETPPEIRAEADRRRLDGGPGGGLTGLLDELDAETAARIDRQNPMRVQRAWEVLRATGRGLAAWQADTGPALLPLAQTLPVVVEADPHWLSPRIAQRFELMLAAGALDEAQAHVDGWDPQAPSSRAIGAAELVAHVTGAMTLDAARPRIVTLTRQYAKRQRTWFRARMKTWNRLALSQPRKQPGRKM